MPDLWSNYPKLPKHVTIIGCGPSAAGRLDEGEYAIALNAAILHPRKWDVFMAFDAGVTDEVWWNPGLILRRSMIAVLGFPGRQTNQRVLSFHWSPPLAHEPFPLSNNPIQPGELIEPDPLIIGRLRGSCGIAGCALQFAAMQSWKIGGKVERITLIGVDMHGNEHHIGRPSSNPRTEGVWPTVPRFKRLMRCIEHHYDIKIDGGPK